MRSPAQTIADRVADAAPGLVIGAHAAALAEYRQQQADYRRRLDDSHRWHAEALGKTAAPSTEEDTMAPLIVTGDVYGSDAAEIVRSLQGASPSAPAPPPAAQSQPANTPAVAPPVAAPASTLGRAAALAAALIAAGGGIGGITTWLATRNATPPAAVASQPAVQPQTEQRLGIEVIPGGASQP